MLAALFEFVAGILSELLLELAFEMLIEFGFYGLYEKLKAPFRNSAVIEATGYVLVGSMLGGASVFVFPNSFIGDPDLQVLNLIITPVLAGLAMMGVGALRRKRGQHPIRLDSFTYGALFAFSLEFVRFLFVG